MMRWSVLAVTTVALAAVAGCTSGSPAPLPEAAPSGVPLVCPSPVITWKDVTTATTLIGVGEPVPVRAGEKVQPELALLSMPRADVSADGLDPEVVMTALEAKINKDRNLPENAVRPGRPGEELVLNPSEWTAQSTSRAVGYHTIDDLVAEFTWTCQDNDTTGAGAIRSWVDGYTGLAYCDADYSKEPVDGMAAQAVTVKCP
jgi:hypothetical protein